MKKLAPLTCLLLSLLITYYVCLRYVFPGYFSPLVPHHTDVYTISVHSSTEQWTLQSALLQPRLAGMAIMQNLGCLGLEGFLLSMVAISLAGIAVLAAVAGRLTGRVLPWLPFLVMYLLAVFGHPGFYINYTYDVFHTIATVFFAAVLLLWYSDKDRPTASLALRIIALTLLSFFTKESYFVALVLFWLCQAAFHSGPQRRLALVLLGATVLSVGLSLGYSRLVHSPWANLQATHQDPYHMDLGFKSISQTYLFYASHWGGRDAWLTALTALGLLRATGGRWRDGLMFFAMGFAMYVPLAVLPNHKLHYYDWYGVPLGMFPILLLKPPGGIEVFKVRLLSPATWGQFLPWCGAAALFGLTGITLLHRGSDIDEYPNWVRQQEVINRNLLQSFARVREEVHSPMRILVLGVNYPLQPFDAPRFMTEYFGQALDVQWTVVDFGPHCPTPQDQPQAGCVRWIHRNCESVNYRDYNLVLVFGPDGRLLRTARKADLPSMTEGCPFIPLDVMADPAFHDLFASHPADYLTKWEELMKVGAYLMQRADHPALARFFLERSASLAGDRSPYPYFYLGNACAALNQPDRAAECFRAAVRLDQTPENPVFRKSLESIKERLASP